MNKSAVSVGDNCIDNYLSPVDRTFIGGNAVNVAIHLQRAGISTAYVGAVGDDAAGHFILAELDRQGLDVSHVQILPGKTARTDIRLGPQGDREFVFEDLRVTNLFRLNDELLEFIARHDLVHNTWLGRSEEALPRYKQTPSLIVSMDYAERCPLEFIDATIQYVDLAFFSLLEAQAEQAEELILSICGRGPRLVVVTLGARGSVAYDGRFHFEPALPVTVIDTLGAGDTYIGVFLADWLDDNDVQECMHHASYAAAKTCLHYGAWLPPGKESIKDPFKSGE